MFLSDEGAIFPSDMWDAEILREHRVNILRRQPNLYFCTWGSRQKSVIARSAPELEAGTVVTGNPRFDLCKAQFSWADAHPAVDRRAEYGPYILVSTRFGFVVHANGYQGQFEMFSENEFSSQDSWFALWRKDAHEFVETVVLIKELASTFKGHTVVVRPHPSESLEFYRAAFSAFPNVVVNRSESITHWIRKAELVVHNNCTTGIEAVLAGRPVLHFLPNGSSAADNAVAREAGWTATSIESAMTDAQRMLNGDVPPHVWSDEATGAILNLTTTSFPVLIDATLRVIRECNLTSPQVVLPRARRAFPRPWRRDSGPVSYGASKRGVFDRTRVEALVSACQASGFGRARVVDVTPESVVIEPA
jgi:surface carbohydrate biosynthesis protein